jgi:hypothetical protein
MTRVNLKELEAFYVKSQQPHAFSTAEIKKEPNGAKIMTFTDGAWKMIDTFYGGEPYGGCLVIEHDGRVVWTQVYYGQVHDTKLSVKAVYDFLRLALREPTEANPFRGPDNFKQGNLEYRNTSKGDFATYSGEEFIYENGQQIYWATYLGGLVDQRASSAD